MFKKLKAKWKVNALDLFLIISTFAIGGSLCGYAGRKLLLLTGLEKNFAWVVLYILLISILWPVCVLIVSIPFGQFKFFKRYILKIWNRMKGKRNALSSANIAIFASGAGSNAAKIIEYFKNSTTAKIDLIVTNNVNAGVLTIARENNIASIILPAGRMLAEASFLKELEKRKIDMIVLAGFLLKLPPVLINAYPKQIINIHPALLPAYGGKGMYGMHVHEAIISNKEKQSGITIHYVDEIYDHGEIIFQSTCDIRQDETTDSLAQKIHALEHRHYPLIIDNILQKKKTS